jgi:hypothetical protein
MRGLGSDGERGFDTGVGGMGKMLKEVLLHLLKERKIIINDGVLLS